MICRLSVGVLAAVILLYGSGAQPGEARPALERQAAAALEGGQYGQAATLFERLAQQNPQTAAYRFQAGLARYQNAEYVAAEEWFRAVLALDPSNAHAQAFLGLSAAASGRLIISVHPLSAAFHAAGIEPELRRLTGVQLARALVSGGEPLQAQTIYTALQREFPDDTEVLYGALLLHLAEGRRLVSQLIRTAPDSWRTHALLGSLLMEKESYAAARDQFEAALRANSRAPGLHRELGDILLAKDQSGADSRREARALYEQELAIDPHDAGTLRRLADLSMLNGNDAEAQQFLTKALAADPHSPATFLSLCKLSSRMGRDPEALSWCSKAVSADPDDAQARYNRARLLRKLGREQEATKEMETFRVLDARKRTESLYMSGAQIGAGQPH